MKYIAKKTVLIGMILMFVSCSGNFLEIDPKQSVTSDDALVTLGDFESAITGVYDRLSSSNYYGRYFILVPDVMSDDVKQNSQANRAKEYAEYVAYAEHFITEDMWTVMYQAVNAANAIINSDAEIPAADQQAYKHIVGEAYALRGQIYFDLVRLYAQHYSYTNDASHPGVPIVLESDFSNEPSRSTVAEVYQQVINDMTTAIPMMQAQSRSGSTSTLTSYAVKALLARVYLYKGDWKDAQDMATDVIDNGPYSLVSNADYVASWSTDYSSESIFEIAMTPTDNRGSDALGRMYIKEGYGDYLPSNDVYSLIPSGDARQGLYVTDPNLSGPYAPYRLGKYPSVQGTDNTKVMRLSEVYLIRAEAAANRTPAQTTVAQNDVDQIRQRGLPSAAPVTATGQALKDEIAKERRIELAFEGQRLWDLMRHKQDMVRTNCTSVASACTVTYPNDRFILPIPAAEILANPNVDQNPDY